MAEGKPVKIISDNAEERVERVGFGFESYIKTISRLIANKENETPLVIGIYGQWGSGKTTLMKNIQACLKDKQKFPLKYYRRCKAVWFQPWKYDKEEEILAALVIFIDDLDRCPKERIKRVLETIKLFMDRRGCIFVIAASRDIVKRALEKDYGADAGYFMEKMVQVTFNLPYIPEDEFKAFIAERRDDIPREFDAHLPLLLPAMKNNPRRLKRFINDTNLQHGLLKNSCIDIDYKLVLLWSIIVCNYPSLMRDIVETRGSFLFDLQARLQESEIKDKLSTPDRWEMTEEILGTFPAPLREYIKDRNLITIISETGVTGKINIGVKRE